MNKRVFVGAITKQSGRFDPIGFGICALFVLGLCYVNSWWFYPLMDDVAWIPKAVAGILLFIISLLSVYVLIFAFVIIIGIPAILIARVMGKSWREIFGAEGDHDPDNPA